jgi:Predicted transcriptional regulator
MSKAILRLNATLAKTGLSRSVLYSEISKGNFPKQIALSERSIGFLESEVDAWIDERIKASRPKDLEANL